MDFIIHLAPVVLVIMAVTIYIFYLMYRRKLITKDALKAKIMAQDEWVEIKDYALLKKSLAVLSLVILGFTLHSILHLETATIALSEAMLLMIWARGEPEEVLLAIEWPTLFFFAGLFVLVGGLIEVGVLDRLAERSMGFDTAHSKASPTQPV